MVLADGVHAQHIADGDLEAATCADCHGNHAIHDPDEPRIMHRSTIQGDYGLGYFEGNAQGDKILEMTV